MRTPENIFLVGPMGAGKTTVGRHLAKALHKHFLDCDRELEARTGASVMLIFELEGESGFRTREQALLDQLSQRKDIVLATGGGAVLSQANRTVLISRGFVIYLDTPIERLLQRTARDRHRPLLQTENAAEKLRSIVAERDPWYRQVADLVVQTDSRSARHTANLIKRQLAEL